MDIAEPPLDKKGSFDPNELNSQAVIEQQRKLLEEMQRQAQTPVCGFCKAQLMEGQDQVMLQTSECFHAVHLECFRAAAYEALKAKKFLYCPECNQPL